MTSGEEVRPLMALSIYEGKRYERQKVITGLVILNTAFGAACVYWWAAMSLLVADPINWAAARHMSARPDLFDFPFSFLWGLPTVCAAGAWILQKAGQDRAALMSAAFPALYIGFIVTCFYVLPIDWR